jgi:hypothetical protein
VVAGPAPAAISSQTTTSGLPRRGDREPATALDEPGTPTEAPDDGEGTTPDAPAGPSEGGEREPSVVASTAPSPVVPRGPSEQPTSGFGGLAVSRPSGPSMYTLAAHQGRTEVNGEATVERPSPDGDATVSGLTRRVPGAQRPDAEVASRAPEAADAEPARTSPEYVYSFLSNFQSGVARGRADAAADTTTNQEDGR